MVDPRLSRLDILDGVGARFNQADANRVLDRQKERRDDPHVPVPYVAPDLPGVDPHGYIALGKGIIALSAIAIFAGAGFVLCLIFGWIS